MLNRLLNYLLESSEKIIVDKSASEQEILLESEEIAPIEIPNQDWTSVHSNFTNELIQKWQEHNFTLEQCRDWINAGLKPIDYNFCAWLRDTKHLTPEQVLNHHQTEELRNEYQQYQTQIQIPPK